MPNSHMPSEPPEPSTHIPFVYVFQSFVCIQIPCMLKENRPQAQAQRDRTSCCIQCVSAVGFCILWLREQGPRAQGFLGFRFKAPKVEV